MKKIFLIYFCTTFLFFTTIKTDKKLLDAYCNLAHLLKTSEQIEKSLSNYQKALDIDPTHLPALLGVATLYIKTKQYDKAIQILQTYLQMNAHCPQAHFYIAQAWQHKKNIEKAKKHYKKAITIDTTYLPAYQKLIHIVPHKKAIRLCKQGLIVDKENIELRKKAIELLIQKKKLDKALQHCNTMIGLKPLHLYFQTKKAQIFTLQGKLDKAIQVFETMEKVQPNNKSIRFNIAHLYKKSGAYEKAIYLLKQLEKLAPENQNITLAMAQSYLALGHYKHGWQYMHQYNSKKQKNIRLSNTKDIAGNIILIQSELYCDQTIQLIRYVQLVKEKGAKKIIVQSPNQLIPLLQKCPFIDEIISSDKRSTCPFHKLVQLSSLPHLFGTMEEHIPNNIPYLFAPQEIPMCCGEKTSQKDTSYKIGIYLAKESTVPAEKLANIAQIKNVSLYVLSNIAEKNYITQIPPTTVVHSFGKGFTECTEDITHLASILPHFDLVICSDSFVGHLAGALAVHTCILLPKATNWQWIEKNGYSLWYPTVTVFRQQENWQKTVDAITLFCKELVSKSTGKNHKNSV